MNLNNEKEFKLINLLHLGLADLTNQKMKHTKWNLYKGINFTHLLSRKKFHMEIEENAHK